MMRAFKTFALAAFASTLCVATANAAEPQSEYGEYEKDHFGIFFVSKYKKECAFDYKKGYVTYLSPPQYVKIGYSVYQKIEAKCEVPYYDHEDQ